jgi:hypothetical protein
MQLRTLNGLGSIYTLAAILAVALLSLAPLAMAKPASLAASGSMNLTSCDVYPNATGHFSWSPGTLTVDVTIPALAGQSVKLDARYKNSAGVGTRIKREFALDTSGRGKVSATFAKTIGSPFRADVVDLTAAGNHVLTTDLGACPTAVPTAG